MDLMSLKLPEASALRLYAPETPLSCGMFLSSILLAFAFAVKIPVTRFTADFAEILPFPKFAEKSSSSAVLFGKS